ncbi:MAG: nitrophenyl compound nitroreductase subunit ArsF family protein [Candidatus Saccharibacteria bacterium]|nr:nitrophenyl compound nitroreductase subunit ArsF family protein [Candidatus Saccharibacteria bacterium]
MMKFLLTLALCVMGAVSAMSQNVEVMYFHGKQRCVTCLSIEKYAQQVVSEEFADELKSGRLKFSVVDISTDEGRKLAGEYKISWSSLIIEKQKDRKDLSQMAFRYAKNQPEEFKRQFRDEIVSALAKK